MVCVCVCIYIYTHVYSGPGVSERVSRTVPLITPLRGTGLVLQLYNLRALANGDIPLLLVYVCVRVCVFVVQPKCESEEGEELAGQMKGIPPNSTRIFAEVYR